MIVYARKGDERVPVQVDEVDALACEGRLYIGSHGYAQGALVRGQGRVLLHRHLLGLVKGDGLIGDHVNGDRLDCRRANLRVVTVIESSQNVSGYGASGVRGVWWNPAKRKYDARAYSQGRNLYLGRYDTLDEAARVVHEWRLGNMPGYVDREGVNISGYDWQEEAGRQDSPEKGGLTVP